MKKLTQFLVALLTLSGAVHAQVENKAVLSLAGARQALDAAIAYAKANQAPGGAIAVVDESGNLLLFQRLEGTFAAAANVSIGKARTAALFKKPTRFFEEAINHGRIAMAAMHENFTPLQGGVPIIANGQVIGAIGVSGAASAQQDEEIGLAGAASVALPAQSTAKN